MARDANTTDAHAPPDPEQLGSLGEARRLWRESADTGSRRSGRWWRLLVIVLCVAAPVAAAVPVDLWLVPAEDLSYDRSPLSAAAGASALLVGVVAPLVVLFVLALAASRARRRRQAWQTWSHDPAVQSLPAPAQPSTQYVASRSSTAGDLGYAVACLVVGTPAVLLGLVAPGIVPDVRDTVPDVPWAEPTTPGITVAGIVMVAAGLVLMGMGLREMAASGRSDTAAERLPAISLARRGLADGGTTYDSGGVRALLRRRQRGFAIAGALPAAVLLAFALRRVVGDDGPSTAAWPLGMTVTAIALVTVIGVYLVGPVARARTERSWRRRLELPDRTRVVVARTVVEPDADRPFPTAADRTVALAQREHRTTVAVVYSPGTGGLAATLELTDGRDRWPLVAEGVAVVAGAGTRAVDLAVILSAAGEPAHLTLSSGAWAQLLDTLIEAGLPLAPIAEQLLPTPYLGRSSHPSQ